ncbi:MAG: cold shock domain-containing protein [Pirellulaceae bacterium]|jgi:cold shock CspA family protein|nr:cold shock domain-containing protein [Pirellulaceae bacterium]
MLYGTVIKFLPAKGFGFIRPDYGPDVFFHITALGACHGEPRIPPGQPVKYELVPGTAAKSKRRRDRDDDEDDASASQAPLHPQAKFVELIDRIPGGTLDESAENPAARHPRARRKKPTWRR